MLFFEQKKTKGTKTKNSVSFFVAISLLCSAGAWAQPTLIPIQVNGPVSNRYNLVFFSEAYTSAQLAQFAADATNAFRGLLSALPFADYSNYFNAYAIAVASAQSGSDHPAYGLYRNTYFNSSYDALSDYVITIPPNQFDSNSSDGQGKVDALIQSLMPNCSLAAMLVNDLTPGGSDGFNKTAIVYAGSGFLDILRHEIGHVAANLGDEYTTPNPGFPNTEEPNTTQQTNRALIKWNAWISPSTPVPTPPTQAYESTVGLFQGAHYHTNGWYRPKFDCTMNHPTYPQYCEVCQEALVLALYRKVRPIDAWSPANTNLTISSPQAQTFSLNLVAPANPNLTIQWSTNGVALAGATNSTLTLPSAALTNGTLLLQASVHDGTARVRTDPTNLLKQTLTWHLNIALAELRLDTPLALPSGHFAFRVTGVAPAGFVIQASQNALAWQPLTTNSLTAGQFWFTNSAPATPLQFFRAVAVQP